MAYRDILDAARLRRGMRPLPVSGIVGMGYQRRQDDFWCCLSCECCTIPIFYGWPEPDKNCIACQIDDEHAAVDEAERALSQ